MVDFAEFCLLENELHLATQLCVKALNSFWVFFFFPSGALIVSADMGKHLCHSGVLVMLMALVQISCSEQLESSQAMTLVKIQKLLNFPVVLRNWNGSTDFCNIEPSSSLTVVCYEGSITQLHIIGDKGARMLPLNFSIVSFVKTLVGLPDLKVLTLASLGLWGRLPGKIMRLSSLETLNMSSNYLYGGIPLELSSFTTLRTLILDENMLSGPLPDWLGSLPGLVVLSLRKNLLNGTLPKSFSNLDNLRRLDLSHNHFYGDVPDLDGLTYLQELHLEDNGLGPKLPKLGNKLVKLVLSNNSFRTAIPAEFSSYYQLQELDLSFNKFVGPFPTSLLSLPSITFLNVADNKLTGMLFDNISCNAGLEFVDFSSNLLNGELPSCLLSGSKDKVVHYAWNCLNVAKEDQHPPSFCQNEALAVGFIPQTKKSKQASRTILAAAVFGGIVGGILLAGLVFLIARKMNANKTIKKPRTRFITESAATGYTSKLLSDASELFST